MSLTDNTEQDNKKLDNVSYGFSCLTGDESAYAFLGFENASDIITNIYEGTWNEFYTFKLRLYNS